MKNRLFRAQVEVDPDLRAIQIAGERVRNIRDDDRQFTPLLEMFLDVVEHLAEAILGDHGGSILPSGLGGCARATAARGTKPIPRAPAPRHRRSAENRHLLQCSFR
jgi:hypothetical protein